MDETEITRQLTTFEELVKHLATKQDLLLLQVDMERLRVELILWIIGTNVAVGAALAFYLNNQLVSQIAALQQHLPH
jgi:hypothetical protein